ncbi:uncharacterized protein LOC116004907 [Ipomoea triloba]|uniref:uncharacterized protein LOC116004907 n=1 Tax=Ipomoea triloba TaxID=35885 RepID=UPI00125D2F92|nr:uncharacterized protein LOC116004907 [Ipomoea triloba]
MSPNFSHSLSITCTRSRSYYESMPNEFGGRCRRWRWETTGRSSPQPMPCLLFERKFLLLINTLNPWSYVPSAEQNKMFNKIVYNVEHAWENTSARNANFFMMISQRNSTTVMNVEYVVKGL